MGRPRLENPSAKNLFERARIASGFGTLVNRYKQRTSSGGSVDAPVHPDLEGLHPKELALIHMANIPTDLGEVGVRAYDRCYRTGVLRTLHMARVSIEEIDGETREYHDHDSRGWQIPYDPRNPKSLVMIPGFLNIQMRTARYRVIDDNIEEMRAIGYR